VIEDDESQRNSIRELIGNETADLTDAANANEAMARLSEQRFDCVVLDLMLPDMSGFDLIDKIRARHMHLPIIVYTGKDLSAEEEEKLNRIAQMTIVKDVAASRCDEVAGGQTRAFTAVARPRCDSGGEEGADRR